MRRNIPIVLSCNGNFPMNLEHDAAREAFIGETIELRSMLLPFASSVRPVQQLAGPEDSFELVEGTPGMVRFRLNQLGDHRLVASFATGLSLVFRVVVFEPECLERVPAMQRSGSAEPRSVSERRAVLRAFAKHGPRDQLTGRACDIRSLQAYGG